MKTPEFLKYKKGDPCECKRKFDLKKSSTYKKGGRPITLLYGSGACTGYVGSDVVEFSGIAVKNQEFGQMLSLGPRFAEMKNATESHMEGILGLGFPQLSATKSMPLLFNMWKNKLLEQPVFSVYMTKTNSATGTNGGVITLGGVDKKYFEGDISYHPVTREGYWQMKMDSVGIAGVEGKIAPRDGKGFQVISDTGTSLIVGPARVIAILGQAIGGQYVPQLKMFVLPCNATKLLPDFIFTFGGVDYHVTPESYLLPLPLEQIQGICFLAMQGQPDATEGNGVDWILGDTFIRDNYQVYDFGQKRVGFAKASHSHVNMN
jgi:pepsin A